MCLERKAVTKPKFANVDEWQQAEILMQPVFIRLIDNIRKALDHSDWQGNYQEQTIWLDGVTPEMQAHVLQVQQQLAIASTDDLPQLEAESARLPQPHPTYQLCLKHPEHERQVTVDLWQLCYQICFKNYNPILSVTDEVTVEVDLALLDETGEVDWQNLDSKTKQLIEQVFASLPEGRV